MGAKCALMHESEDNKEWLLNGKLHRDDDLPALECANGDKLWYRNGKLHREGDRPAIEHANGNKWWYHNGELHRDNDLPAFTNIEDGTKYWYRYGNHHRDGMHPAIMYLHGRCVWYKRGMHYTEQQLIDYCIQLVYFGKLCLGKIKRNILKNKKWIHGELLCKPPKGNFLGGADYHRMVDYFNNL